MADVSFTFSGDAASLQNALNEIKGEVRKTKDSVQGLAGQFTASFAAIGGAIAAVKGAFAFFSNIPAQAARIEDLRVTFTQMTGDAEQAGQILDDLWHDAREDGIDEPENAYVPSADELNKAAKHTDINDVIINVQEQTVFLADPMMSLDVGALGKGYATEKAAELLMDLGVTSYVLNIGGNIRTIGAKVSGNGWITGITNPDKNSAVPYVCKVIIKDVSLVTSGDYERYYVVGNTSYHHIIDPKTNMPANYFSSVSIFTKDSGLADALSTALFCMSYEDGLALIKKIGGVDAIWVSRDGTLKMTDGITLSE